MGGAHRWIVEWWPKDFYIGTYDGIEPVGMEMETRPGGRLVEHWPEARAPLGDRDHGPLPAAPHPTGDCAPAFGGPNRAFTEYRLEERDGGSELRFSRTPFGVVSEETAGTLSAGWASCSITW